MAIISFNMSWESEFYNNVSANDRVQDIILNQLKNKVNDTDKKGWKLTTKIEHNLSENVMNKAYPDTKL